MKKVYIERIEGEPHLPLLFPNFGPIDRPERLFTNSVLQTLKEPFVEVVGEPEAADYFLIPHDFYRIAGNTHYLKTFADKAERYNKKILVFDYSDYDSPIEVPNSIIFRLSQYRYKKASNEIIAAPFVEDLGAREGIVSREKGDKPVVGFCGWADFESVVRRLRYYVRLMLVELSVLRLGAMARVHRTGLYFRRRAIARLAHSPLVKANFLVRRTFSSHRHSISMDPEVARREYIENMKASDLALAPKGDGNYSMRFYEALSLGRIPLLIDTDTPLPLEDDLDYSSFTLRVPYQDIARLPEIVADFYNALSNEQFEAMQRAARRAFETRLSGEAFLRHSLERLP